MEGNESESSGVFRKYWVFTVCRYPQNLARLDDSQDIVIAWLTLSKTSYKEILFVFDYANPALLLSSLPKCWRRRQETQYLKTRLSLDSCEDIRKDDDLKEESAATLLQSGEIIQELVFKYLKNWIARRYA